MNIQLTSEQIAQYRNDGFLIIHDFLSPEELEQWRCAIDTALIERGEMRLPGDKVGVAESPTFDQRLNLWQTSEAVRELILSEAIGRMACELEGIEAMRVWHDQALVKQPWADPTPWHQDDPHFSFDSPHCTSIWLALDDVTMQNGCLYFLPGTHKRIDYAQHGFGPKLATLFEALPQWKEIEPMPSIIKAGSCSFHNGLTAHAAGPNMTLGKRRAMTCAFMPDGATFNGKANILPQEMVARLKVGDALDDEAQNPIVYSALSGANKHD